MYLLIGLLTVDWGLLTDTMGQFDPLTLAGVTFHRCFGQAC